MKKRKNVLILGMLAMVLVCVIGLTGCTSSDWAIVADSLSSANNSFANAYSSSSQTGMTYTIYNRSSVTVSLWDSTGEVTIRPGGSASARFNSSATIYDVYYSPSSVKVTQSGYSFTFSN